MRYFYSLLIVAIVLGCAQINPLTGGKKDVYAPAIDSAKTQPFNGAKNFTGNEVNLVFNEYIILKNPIGNILVTPQLKTPPTYAAKNKKFTLKFNETLTPNTTYLISFNRAIVDYKEQNDSVFQFVFSTGNYIDSIQISGLVKSAFTNRPVSDVIIGIYPKNDTIDFDSIPQKIKPTYLALTGEDGKFKVQYIKNGLYHVFAFIDKDNNLLFNPKTERIGFINEQIVDLNQNKDSVVFRLFEPIDESVKIKDYSLYYPGRFELKFTNAPKKVNVQQSTELLFEKTDRKDSLIYWLTELKSNSSKFIVQYDLKYDSLSTVMKNIPKEAGEIFLEYTSNLHAGKLLPGDSLHLIFNEPIQTIDNNLIHVYDADSVPLPFQTEVYNVTQLKLLLSEERIEKYVQIDSGAITSYFGHQNKTIKLNYLHHGEKYYGTLIVDLSDSLKQNAIVNLLNKKGKVIQTFIVKDPNESIIFRDLTPDTYRLRLIADKNKDSKWTSGDIKNNIQPEHIYYYDGTVKVRSNWDMEITWQILD